MRRVISFSIFLCVSAIVARAQEQERKLMDRILKPDMALENSAQHKQFAVSGGAAPTKIVRPKMFHFLQRGQTKNYAGVRSFETQNFETRNSSDQRRAANLATRNAVTENRSPFATTNYSGVRPASDAQKAVNVSEFNDSKRAFLVRGKSQNALSAQDHPLTIDEVRELLNKNK